jgi:prepilin-type N-terminal cleavage/methylation domain-containing protein
MTMDRHGVFISNRGAGPRRRGFTLIEMMAVVAVLALLLALLFPALSRARRQARRNATRSTFQSLSTALEQYKADWGVYPRSNGADEPKPPTSVASDARTGAEMLVDFLCGPSDDYRDRDGNLDPAELTYVWLSDPAETTPAPGTIPARSGLKKMNVPGLTNFGKTIGPYMEYSPKRVVTITTGPNLSGSAGGIGGGSGGSGPENIRREVFADSWGRPILYWRARRGAFDPDSDPLTWARQIFPVADNVAVLDSKTYSGLSADNTFDDPAMWTWTKYLRQERSDQDVVLGHGNIPDRDKFLLISAGPNGRFGWPTLTQQAIADMRTTNESENDDILSCRLEGR